MNTIHLDDVRYAVTTHRTQLKAEIQQSNEDQAALIIFVGLMLDRLGSRLTTWGLTLQTQSRIGELQDHVT